MRTSTVTIPASATSTRRRTRPTSTTTLSRQVCAGKPAWANDAGGLHLVSQYLRGEQRSQWALRSVQHEVRPRFGHWFDRRHIFNVSYVYALPWFTKSSNVAAREVLGGWSDLRCNGRGKGVPLYHHLHRLPTLSALGCCLPTGRIWCQRLPTPRRRPPGSAPVRMPIQPLPGPAARIRALATRKRLSRGTGNLQLESLPVQDHSTHLPRRAEN
jgi:hypothetical protein